MERRLAAILAADIVGYSRMVGEDEAATLSAIRINLKDVIQPLATRHRGRIVKLMGDGILMEFSSAVDAVVFAVGMQCAMQTRNDCLPDARKVLYRIGINVGDVIFEDGDIFGDGVNIAARLESIAKPGGICIAESAFGQVRGKLKLTFNAQGQRKVKNIAEPVTVWEISVDEHARNIATESADNTQEERSWTIPVAAIIALACIAAGLAWFQFWSSPVEVAGSRVPPATPVGAPVSDKPSIAVLPYVNLSNDKEQEYFSDGLSEDLTTDLSRLSGLIVISRTSSFAYKAQTVDIRTIGRELGARYVLEGSVRRVGERVRINTQLIDTLSGNHIWAERFDRDWGQILVLQDEVRAKIVQSLKVKLSVREEQRLARHPTDNPEAYDLYLRGLQQESYFTREGNEESRRLFSLAIELDPKFAMAYGHLALAYSLAQENSWAEGGDAQVEKTLALARKSVELDADLPQARWSLGRVYARARPPHRDYGRAIEELERAVRLDPNYADGYALLANVLSTVGRPGEALNAIEKAIQINPHHPFWYLHTLGVSQFLLARFEIAEKSFSEASKRNPNVTWMHAWLLSTYGHLGKRENAAWEVSELEGLNQPVTLEKLRDLSFVEDTASLKLFLEGLRKAGVPES